MDDTTPEDIEGLARLRRHLYEGGSARLPEAAAACGLRISALVRWLADGRLRRIGPTAVEPVTGVVCANAGPPDLCGGCRRRPVAAVSGTAAVAPGPAPPAPPTTPARRHSGRRT